MKNQKGESDRWVWVFVQGESGGEQFLGQMDPEGDISFVPAFLEKEDALAGLNRLAREKNVKYEAQAIRLDDLRRRAGEGGFKVFILDQEGRVIEKD